MPKSTSSSHWFSNFSLKAITAAAIAFSISYPFSSLSKVGNNNNWLPLYIDLGERVERYCVIYRSHLDSRQSTVDSWQSTVNRVDSRLLCHHWRIICKLMKVNSQQSTVNRVDSRLLCHISKPCRQSIVKNSSKNLMEANDSWQLTVHSEQSRQSTTV